MATCQGAGFVEGNDEDSSKSLQDPPTLDQHSAFGSLTHSTVSDRPPLLRPGVNGIMLAPHVLFPNPLSQSSANSPLAQPACP